VVRNLSAKVGMKALIDAFDEQLKVDIKAVVQS
jgi:hypothetical protein